MTDQYLRFNEIAQAIEKAMLPYACECIRANEISMNIVVTARSDPARTVTVPGVYLPSLGNSDAVEKLADEIRFLIAAED